MARPEAGRMMGRKHLVALGGVVTVAFLVRLLVLLEGSDDILFDYPALDEQRYVDLAREVATGGTAPVPYWQPPGLLYVLTVCFKVAGNGLWLPHILQVLVSTAACLLLFAIGRRLFDVRVGITAAAIGALHGIFILASFELLPATWILFLDLTALQLLLCAEERKTLLTAFSRRTGRGSDGVLRERARGWSSATCSLTQKARPKQFRSGVARPRSIHGTDGQRDGRPRRWRQRTRMPPSGSFATISMPSCASPHTTRRTA
jgi:hypothetical protein